MMFAFKSHAYWKSSHNKLDRFSGLVKPQKIDIMPRLCSILKTVLDKTESGTAVEEADLQ